MMAKAMSVGAQSLMLAATTETETKREAAYVTTSNAVSQCFPRR